MPLAPDFTILGTKSRAGALAARISPHRYTPSGLSALPQHWGQLYFWNLCALVHL